ncbi:PREDICTED: facilitated trehalose transporter Tret1-like [Diuraphis noxia]|uniref:facilitated trehalose transporter Tret1-like n=1 Tax=Diuraphis noxia TaxID=143948 RepID=UPI0007637216|nr:PREDICTED: facilitated trehalose transporter Tret1-like [Diuraphis noxia]
MNKKTFRENERLIGTNEAEKAKSCRRQLSACFLASLMSLSAGTVIAGWSPTEGSIKENDLKKWSTEQESWIISIYVLGALLGALPAGFLGQKYGRKSLLLWLAGPMIVGWILCLLRLESVNTLVDSSWRMSLLLILCVFISAFRLGLGPIPWFISTELSPALYGGRIQSIAASFSWSLSFVIMKTFKIFVEANPVMLWCSFAAFSAAGLLFVLFYVPETNNKSREQIHLELIR